MATPGTVNIALRKLSPKHCDLVVNVKITHEFKLRIWLATRLVMLAAYIMGMGYREEDE